MKTHIRLAAVLLGFGLAAASTPLLIAQNPATASPSQLVQGGVLLRDDGLFWVSGGKAGHLDASTVPQGQMVLSDGRLQALPAGISGLPEGVAVAPDARSARDLSGITLVNDQVYIIANGKATPVKPTAIPAGHMITWEGKTTPAPSDLTFIGRVTPGTVTPGVVTPGSVSIDGSVRGGDVKGGDVKGGDVKGGDVKGN
ncbi:hypothetical protein WJU23_01920 [Prosthecobacter sp. SYSU 5D2]|uniref:hypothetical protein n=1 Tax=Prosthecobacter sp. SYSU 5D2 TaxID=3134134 RepID=UPI0031FEBC1C